MELTYKITGGVYLVVNPAMEKNLLLQKLSAALKGGLAAVQIWNNWPDDADKLSWIEAVAGLTRFYKVPLLINQEWELLKLSPYLNGVHFDGTPAGFDAIRQAVGRPFLAGITCSGNLDHVNWAHHNQLDYISFCSMFPSPSAGSCDIVMPATVTQAQAITQIPIFVSGGITPENILSLKQEISFDGVAAISGILSADDPEQKVKQYKDALCITTPIL
ncbi:thiamine phosphate synthase [Mucilaginibacter sp. FT3.2]|uniref:thiamine phosphate synthase n=1 Tax=Mucilaginibacter sp. FT3.2 TaxID=2723090 RepID=UPI00160931A5|nr:thiamine-phosphate pyrophosphorylase [Mucilaginibacter sp. FT3.2]